MKNDERPPVSFGTCVMVYTMAMTKALLPDKNLKESITPEESEKITSFINKVIDEAFDETTAPMMKQAFAMELQLFNLWTTMKLRDAKSSA